MKRFREILLKAGSFFALMTLAFVVLSGCSYSRKGHPSYCSSNTDCAEGYKCSEKHYCVLGSTCTTDADCGEGFTCNKLKGCLKKPECEEGAKESCYSGASGTKDIGLCRGGQRVCAGGFFTDCLGQVLGTSEQCNGLDDDCDGETDELDNTECDNSLAGACAKGKLVCSGAFAVCQSVAVKTPEKCNGVDDDCDGVTDEGTGASCYPEGAKGCEKFNASFLCKGVCSSGKQECSNGILGACVGAVTPKEERCSDAGAIAQDEDCDGEVDEGCPCDPSVTPSRDCYAGPVGTQGVGTCKKGTQTCSTTTKIWGACVGQVLPQAETCLNDREDNDCDGVTDNLAGSGDFCVNESYQGICREGTMQCPLIGASLYCKTIEPRSRVEVCDGSGEKSGTDEDCDGLTDEGFDLSGDEANCGACGRRCATGQTCCQGNCVDLNTDAKFCGACDVACGAGLSCCSGQCVEVGHDEKNCGGCGTVCGNGKQCCASTCTNTEVDTANCGDCGLSCAQGQYCCSGKCSLETCSCLECEQSGGTCCGALCVDIKSDSTNCGGCGRTCDQDKACTDGICCASGQINCGGTCTDLTRDKNNCGGCGTVCDETLTCCSACVNTQESRQHCGACDNACSWFAYCSKGLCCTQGYVNCSGKCVDVTSDETNCGSCGNACGNGETCCSGVCADTQSDNANCGSCGTVCSSSSTNRTSQCCLGVCVSYAVGNGSVLPGIPELCQCATTCSGSTVCCRDTCVNLWTDPKNCGACDNVCTTGCCRYRTCVSASYCSSGS